MKQQRSLTRSGLRPLGVCLGILLNCLAMPAWASPCRQDPVIDYQSEIAPLFGENCLRCHGPARQESSYRLDTRELALASGDLDQPTLIPGDAANSPLFQYAARTHSDLAMPPEGEGEPLSAAQVEKLKVWIEEGAVWPESEAGQLTEAISTDHWSFRQPVEPVLPAPAREASPTAPPWSAIDHFLLDRLHQSGLQAAPQAEKRVLIRRLYLVMLGLLPTPEEVQRFVADESPEAWGRLVEEVLASPHYGERWARHWLDIVRFGESTGFEVNRDRANAWWYRDYVIESLNADKSYQQFVREQLAGDALGCDEATGFLVGGTHDIVSSPDINLTLMQRQDELADYVNTVSTTFLGLTVACARCHNHKFDPLLQRDYFALQAFFTGVQHGERPLVNRAPEELRKAIAANLEAMLQQEAVISELAASVAAGSPVVEPAFPAVDARLNTDAFAPRQARFVRFLIARSSSGEPCLDELEVFTPDGVNVAAAEAGGRPTSSGNYADNPKHRLEHLNDGQFGNDRSWISDTSTDAWVQIELASAQTIERVVWARDRNGIQSDRLPTDYEICISEDGEDWQWVAGSELRPQPAGSPQVSDREWVRCLPVDRRDSCGQAMSKLRTLQRKSRAMQKELPLAYVGTFQPAEPVFRLHRGDPLAPRERVEPDVPTVFGGLKLPAGLSESEARVRLADWLASPDNPLVARVIVNRVWQFHFGRGIVATPSDFGTNGARPTHPELLDWLTLRFIEHGWSLKWLHRQILASRAWGQSSQPAAKGLVVDADCQLLWRFPPRRLEAEAIRDCVLQASGKLDLRRGGPGYLLFEIDRENVHHYFPLEQFGPEHFRRMIYMTKIRQESEDVFGAFDCPDGGQTMPVRNRSTTPLQALNLLNSRFMIGQSGFLAERLRTSAGSEVPAQVRLAIRWLMLRETADDELAEHVAFVEQQGLEDYCRALLNANEFLFLD